MSYYVYRYVHPDYPWLYVGLSTDLPFRIYMHNNSANDNIDRKWEKYLRESKVYYHECSDEQDMRTTEKYLINTFKPVINKMDKSDGESSIPPMDIGWTLYAQEDEKSQNKRKSTKGTKQIHGPVMIYWREEIHRAISEYFFPYLKSALDGEYDMMEFDLSDVPIECNLGVMLNLYDSFAVLDADSNLVHIEEQIEAGDKYQYIKFQIKPKCFEYKAELKPFYPTSVKRGKYDAVYLGSNRNANKWEYGARERKVISETLRVIDNVKIARWDGGDIFMRHIISFWDFLSESQKHKTINTFFGIEEEVQ